MGAAPRTVRCYDCQARQTSDRTQCSECAAQFLRLCRGCGAEGLVFDRECAACGRALRTGRPRRGTRVKWILPLTGVLAVLALGVAAWTWFPRRLLGRVDRDLRAQALELYHVGDFEAAAAAFTELGDALQADAPALAALGECRLHAGGDAETPLRAALRIDPRQEGARLSLADMHARRGRTDLAAALLEEAPGHLSVELLQRAAATLLEDVEPDVERALARLETALERGPPSLGLLDAALGLQLRCFGPVPPETRLPPRIERVVAALEERLADVTEALPAEAAARARLQLVRRRPGDAEAGTEQALSTPELRPADRATLSLLRGLARAERRRVPQAVESFLAAVEAQPNATTVQRAVDHLLQAGAGAAVLPFLRDAAAGADSQGALHGVLAAHELAARRLEAADAAVRAALMASPGNAFFLRVRGDVETASGDLKGAAASYAEAESTVPGLLRTRLRAALLSAASGSAGHTVALNRLSGLRAAFPEDDRVPLEVGALLLSAGDGNAAVGALEDAAALFPRRVRTWRLLARAWLQSGRSNGLESAALAIARARRLRPGDAGLAADAARVRLGTRNASGAALLCSQMIDAGRGSPELLRLRARAFVLMESWDRAVRDLRAVLREVPDSAADYLALVDAEYRAGRIDVAERLCVTPPDALGAPGRELLRLVRELHTQ